MDSVISVNNVAIRLTEERWLHIIDSHDDLAGRKEDVLKTIAEPDFIVRGIRKELLAVRKVNNSWIVSVYKEIIKSDGFIITAFTTSRIAYLLKKETLWKKQ